MTEDVWLNCASPDEMLQFLRAQTSDRKLRLFAVACCRRIWDLLPNIAAREFLQTIERYADHSASDKELAAAYDVDCLVQIDADYKWNIIGTEFAIKAVEEAGRHRDGCSYDVADQPAPVDPECRTEGWRAANGAAYNAMYTVGCQNMEGSNYSIDGIRTEQAAQADLLRDIVGNPFRHVAVDPRWQTPAVAALATAIYEQHAFERFPMLAAALVDSGCDNTDVLGHCRRRGPHTRGCWVVDLLIGKL